MKRRLDTDEAMVVVKINLFKVKAAIVACAVEQIKFNRRVFNGGLDWIPTRHRYAFGRDC
ncbi:hypothetical protein [Azonexus hydrophilus]|uniref:Uncharacterized protein n=1 Tax=Azonexus hydrophilus TaxID=418702 RepID=A0ABZ2XM48_9RHOO